MIRFSYNLKVCDIDMCLFFSQGILGMLSAFSANLYFFNKCYIPLADLMDCLALINSTINFLIYYFMSKQFRKTFNEMFGVAKCCPENMCAQWCNGGDNGSNQGDAGHTTAGEKRRLLGIYFIGLW